MDTPTQAPKKVAILVGGVSSITTALELTEDPNWKEKYDITLYQMGWRLGGKGASGRNRAKSNRIEEHGLHLWFGFYDNAFDLIQRCYKANNRPLDKPLATWQEAFKPYDLVVLEELVGDKWEHWPFKFPRNRQMPGTLDTVPSVWEYFGLALSHLHSFYQASKEALDNPIEDEENDPKKGKREHHSFFDGLEEWGERIGKELGSIALDIGGKLIFGAMKLVESTIDSHHGGHHNTLLIFIDRILRWLWRKIEHKIEENTVARHLWIAMDFALSNMRGMIKDGVVTEGFDVINNIDYRDWIKKHGASEITLTSAPVQAIYGLVFGGYKFYTFEAGTALRGALRMALTYRGAVYYRMQAGMGDTIFGPAYEVLKKRGIKFEFFHKVLNLNLNTTTKTIDSIDIGVQATVKAQNEYNPLFNVRNLPCWPSNPLYEQLEQGEELKSQKINLESYWSPWKNVAEKTLVRGRDYDIIVQGISIGALPVIAKELVEFSDDWKAMVKMVTATETQAFQLWFHPDVSGLGWPFWMEDMPLSGTYQEPFDTWADMSDLIIRETWPNDAYPNNIAYVCGPVERKVPYQWNFNDHGVPDKALEKVKQTTLEYLKTLSHHLWPNTSPESDPSDFNWNLLVDPSNQQGQARFDEQFFKVNIDPSELYVLSETNSSKHRLKTDQNGFNDFYITGDWIDNGFNAGCVEAAVIAGKQTARAISGKDFEIPGEQDKF
ncbi:MAG: NAD(P)-binding protein [Bacteroidota bacterium]